VRLGYARVSKGDDQSNVAQARALKEAGCTRIFEDAASGARWDRPELLRLLDQLRDGDTVVVWKLDRLSRSLKDVLHIMERIATAGAGFQSLTEAIDTTTPAGRMLMHMVGGVSPNPRKFRPGSRG
jgi:DNA invertase Pin-like site-specific DNA recombinase